MHVLDEARTATSQRTMPLVTEGAHKVRDEVNEERAAGRAAEMRHVVDPLDASFARLAPSRADEPDGRTA